MRRSEINLACLRASHCFTRHYWALPPGSKWDVTDFGLGDFPRYGLTLVNLATEPEYCEKVMYARAGQETPCHCHARKKEDIICRVGMLEIRIWATKPLRDDVAGPGEVLVPVDGQIRGLPAGRPFRLEAGRRVTLAPGLWHSFVPFSKECVIGEVSTANDDLRDNFFLNPNIGRFPGIVEDEPARFELLAK